MASEVYNSKLIRLLIASTHSAFLASLQGTRRSSKQLDWLQTLPEGSLVMETSTIYKPELDMIRIGYLVSKDMEPMYADAEWERIKYEWHEDDPRPTERIYRIKLLTTGEEQAWNNATFIRVPESRDDFSFSS